MIFMNSYYLKYEYNPAQEWFKNQGAYWIKKYIANSEWILTNYDKITLGVYKVTLNNEIAYIGEAVKVANRLVVHAWNLARASERYYGVLPDEIEKNIVQISMECIESGIDCDREREKKEVEYIKKLKPYLQVKKTNDSVIPNENKRYDLCIYPKGKRRNITKDILDLD